MSSARKVAYVSVPHASTKGRTEIHLSSETLEMNLNLLFSALLVLLMIPTLVVEWTRYLDCMLRVKLLPDVRSERNPPLQPLP